MASGVALQALLLMLCVHLDVHGGITLIMCVWDRERDGLTLPLLISCLSVSLLQSYCSSLSHSHTLCCLLVRELGRIGVCQLRLVSVSSSSGYVSGRGSEGLAVCSVVWFAENTLSRCCLSPRLWLLFPLSKLRDSNWASHELQASRLVFRKRGVLWWKGGETGACVLLQPLRAGRLCFPIKDQASCPSSHTSILCYGEAYRPVKPVILNSFLFPVKPFLSVWMALSSLKFQQMSCLGYFKMLLKWLL